MKVYISSSFKNIHLVRILTIDLRDNDIEVLSFLDSEHNKKHKVNQFGFKFDLEEFINSDSGDKQFKYDLDLINKSDIIIYISPSGVDSWAEIGCAFAQGKRIYGLYSKGEEIGLFRKMVIWEYDYTSLLISVCKYASNME